MAQGQPQSRTKTLKLDLKDQTQRQQGQRRAKHEEKGLRFASFHDTTKLDGFASFDYFVIVGRHVCQERKKKQKRVMKDKHRGQLFEFRASSCSTSTDPESKMEYTVGTRQACNDVQAIISPACCLNVFPSFSFSPGLKKSPNHEYNKYMERCLLALDFEHPPKSRAIFQTLCRKRNLRDVGLALHLGLGASFNGRPETRKGQQVQTQDGVVAVFGIGYLSRFGEVLSRIG